jgi:hypothetical protein
LHRSVGSVSGLRILLGEPWGKMFAVFRSTFHDYHIVYCSLNNTHSTLPFYLHVTSLLPRFTTDRNNLFPQRRGNMFRCWR